jgi:hypothetical protein
MEFRYVSIRMGDCRGERLCEHIAEGATVL